MPRPRPAARVAPSGDGARLELPLSVLLAQLPPELQSRVEQTYADEVHVLLPLEKILPQLGRGVVRISFGELRRAAPPGTFSGRTDLDGTQLPVPLQEVLARIDPALLPRRPAQKQVSVPEEIAGPFGANGDGLFFSVAATQPDAVPATPAARAVTPRQAAPLAPSRASITSVPPVSPPSVPAVTPPRLTPPAAPAAIPFNADLPDLTRAPGRVPAPAAPVATAPAATPGALTAAPAPGNGSVLTLVLTDLVKDWPEAVLQDIERMNLSSALVCVPMPLVEAGLKAGKVAFAWKQLRGWLKPQPAPAISLYDEAVLELPLKLIAPLFLAKQKAASAQQKVPVDANIPNLFFGGPQSETAPTPQVYVPTPPPKPADTNYYVWNDGADTPQDAEVLFKRGSASPGTAFLRRYATPNEIVSKAAALDGVAGALIALPDGLLVASQVPADLNGETLAAFLPQIFGRVSQCTKELRMGELNNLNFTVGNVPWKIFRVGAIFFAAFGRAGEPLPGVPLAGLAAELDRNPR